MLTAPQFSPAALQIVRARIVRAAERAGRDPGSIRLLAVSKQQPAALVRAAAAAGQTEFGENYVQEGIDKVTALADVPGLVWHFIGQLQGNKTRDVAERFDWVHTVDRERIAWRLSAQRPHDAAPLQVLLQVRLADEPGKAGVTPAQVPALAAAVAALPRLRLRGLMCIPPPAADQDAQRRPFRQLRELMESLGAAGYSLDTLSMGMSDDLEAAVLEGATIVRVGTAIFGRRPG
ncbi:MAG: YggS family pyridoxal phosphate-dependent enzyme [Gammaproteobacteria bacterium]|nr:YggS family pyridoxal phosphate-dependent enzyme [Gammaproteobacteria bacterium]MDH4311475.1 YggS family pyridoxal phosphate-dependent enzyme [Gammaproteobacteria bacterium]MDH5273736.1 YggS family pyridoxal phosphate-dependent enzyme [Gammaproteobacteria bacterium]